MLVMMEIYRGGTDSAVTIAILSNIENHQVDRDRELGFFMEKCWFLVVMPSCQYYLISFYIMYVS